MLLVSKMKVWIHVPMLERKLLTQCPSLSGDIHVRDADAPIKPGNTHSHYFALLRHLFSDIAIETVSWGINAGNIGHLHKQRLTAWSHKTSKRRFSD